ncbi:MAG: hypothetical protein KKD44_17305 [Proteobacteria bacterium]|nr:hypothetical protein [Pseudomonadota bacterium]
MNLLSFAEKYGYDLDVVEKALRLAIEESFRRSHNINSVDVSLDDKTIDVVYRIPVDLSLSKALIFDHSVIEGDVIRVQFNIKDFPDHLVHSTKTFFSDALMDLSLQRTTERWASKKHTVVDGEIMSCSPKMITVNVGDEHAIFPRSFWVPTEKPFYLPGCLMKFYVAKITINPLVVIVSRSAKDFPALLLKEILPFSSFTTLRRFIGHISFIESDALFTIDLINAIRTVRSQLNMEAIDIVHPSI